MARLDHSFNQIGKRLRQKGPLADDDRARVAWIYSVALDSHAAHMAIELGAADGGITKLLRTLTHRIMAVEPHPNHRPLRDVWWYAGTAAKALDVIDDLPFPNGGDPIRGHVVYACELLEHLSRAEAVQVLLQSVRVASDLVVTVPNQNCKSFKASKRERDSFPDHKQHFSAVTLRRLLERCWWTVDRLEPIVGESLKDSIWLGAVCHR